MFRPDYENYDDTINANRILNLTGILNLRDSIGGFPSHNEFGYKSNLRGQNHHIVLHHTAQRRSYDKGVIDLEPILYDAVKSLRLNPEQAIRYLSFQNDLEKGVFEVYSTWQYTHSLLPDSLNNKVWLIKMDSDQKAKANSKRKLWNANSLEEVATKSSYIATSKVPFIFSSVQKSAANLEISLDKDSALLQYEAITSLMDETK